LQPFCNGFVIFIIVKRIFLLLLSIAFAAAGYAQQSAPSYIDVIKKFCSTYEASEEYENYTSFAKKKKGWYVLQVNKIQSDRTLEERLFYSFSENKYLDLGKYYTKAGDVDMEKQLERFLNNGGGTSDWYGFERIAYYGYNGWYIDMIKDFGSQKDLSDTMHDALGRAYINLANSYLWYQSGGMYPEYDTLHRKLDRLEYPTAQRIGKVKEAVDNAIVQFDKLNSINPSYNTIVGNSSLKLFNEYMHGYNQMIMCGNDELARQYIEKAPLPEPYILQAKNYLNSCEPNAILFSYGDNDTYQLWYVQEKYDFRKDVLVINNSLLGLPVYIDMFKRKKMLSLSIPDSFLRYPENDVIYFSKDKKTGDVKKTVSLNEFLKIIYTKRYPSSHTETGTYPTYPYSSASLTFRVYSKNAPGTGVQKTISFDLSENYYFMNDIAVFDIVFNNVANRPVYFTSTQNPFEKNLMQKGIVYKLILANLAPSVKNETEAKGLEKFIAEKYTPVLSNDTDLVSFDGDNTFFTLYYSIFRYYLEKKDTINFKKWLYKLDAACPKINATQINMARSLVYYFIEAGDTGKGLAIAKQYAQWLNRVYSDPGSLTGYYSQESYTGELTKLRDYLASKDLNLPLLDSLLKE